MSSILIWSTLEIAGGFNGLPKGSFWRSRSIGRVTGFSHQRLRVRAPSALRTNLRTKETKMALVAKRGSIVLKKNWSFLHGKDGMVKFKGIVSTTRVNLEINGKVVSVKASDYNITITG
jgi:hypothetical protein